MISSHVTHTCFRKKKEFQEVSAKCVYCRKGFFFIFIFFFLFVCLFFCGCFFTFVTGSKFVRKIRMALDCDTDKIIQIFTHGDTFL